ncbi:MAG: phenylalanine--tRNA ligase subunit beta [Bacteroidales bacterium]
MKISLDWLNEYIELKDTNTETLLETLTDIGLEVGGTEIRESIPGSLEGIVTGKVKACEKHPNADKLSITKVDIGSDRLLPIVCGAPNVAEGQTVAVATVGTTLHMNGEQLKIKKAKLRGEPSEGMICAEDEIGLGSSHAGIMVLPDELPAGMPLSEYFEVSKDLIIDIDLTPNRIDAASHMGTARDLAARHNFEGKHSQLIKPDVSDFKADNTSLTIPVSIENPEACKRYVSCTISEIEVKESPAWLKKRLESIGLKSVNNVVDVTNFVLHETGHPLHAFDVDEIKDNQVIVKKMPEGTSFTTLDEVERKLSSQDLMICNPQEPMCIAGVLGGIESGITEKSRAVFLESAWFDPVHVRSTARRHGISTDASFRYERGADPGMCIYALKRAALLIKEVSGGKISSEISDVYPQKVKAAHTEIRYDYLNSMFGTEIPAAEIKEILTSLDIRIRKDNDTSLEVEIPPYRHDVRRPADVAEEILRIYGYNNTPVADKLHASINISHEEENEKLQQSVSDFLSARGFNEIMSNSLSNDDYYKGLETFKPDQLVYLANPGSSELNIMRRDLLFSGLEAIARNINHRNKDLRLYEFGKIYFKAGEKDEQNPVNNYFEEKHLGLWLSGNFHSLHWNQKAKTSDFYHIKSAADAICESLGIDKTKLKIKESKSELFEYGLGYKHKKRSIFELGLVKHSICHQLDIEQDVYYADFSFEALKAVAKSSDHQFKQLARFPAVHRDLALLLDKDVNFEDLRKAALQAENKYLKSVDLFDVYEGENIEEGKKSYALSFVLQDEEKTMQDIQIDKIMQKLSRSFEKQFDAKLR